MAAEEVSAEELVSRVTRSAARARSASRRSRRSRLRNASEAEEQTGELIEVADDGSTSCATSSRRTSCVSRYDALPRGSRAGPRAPRAGRDAAEDQDAEAYVEAQDERRVERRSGRSSRRRSASRSAASAEAPELALGPSATREVGEAEGHREVGDAREPHPGPGAGAGEGLRAGPDDVGEQLRAP